MLSYLKTFFDTNERQIAEARKTVKLINDLEPEVEKMSYADMQQRIAEMKGELSKLVEQVPDAARSSIKAIDRSNGFPKYEQAIQDQLLKYLPEVYAFIVEVYKREIGIRHYDVQLIAGVILAHGQKLTELKTGEGKTMLFQLPLFLYSLVGRGAHLVTVNDYLVKRDAEYAGHIASKLGITVGVVSPGQVSYRFVPTDELETVKGADVAEEVKKSGKPRLSAMKGLSLLETSKTTAYGCDIVYSMNSELGFDYLRDNMAPSMAARVQRELYFCIVDEADSILIDESRTPLIISAVPEESDTEKYVRFAAAAAQLVQDKDYTVDHKSRSVLLTEEGIQNVEKILGIENVWANYSYAHHLDNALKAQALFQKDDHYLLRDGEVMIVDPFTGRVMPGRRYSEGLHQAIEAKEKVEIKQEAKTIATISFQNFFRLYKILGGGSGTILTEAEEFYKIYNLESVAIPTNRPVVREDLNDLIYKDQTAKFAAVVKDIATIHETGQPVLVGTRSIEKSELVSQALDDAGIPHSVLNAKYHEYEAQIVAKAGELGAVTVATNMAGRGTDIPLADGVREVGGLAVIGTERHEARRIDNQLRGRAGRQGDPGFSRFYVSLDDEIMRIMGGDILAKSVGRIMDPEAPIELGMISKQIETAQKRVEWANFDSRKTLVEYDDVMNKQREVFYARRLRFLKQTEDAAQNKDADATGELKAVMSDLVLNELQSTISNQYRFDKQLDEERLNTLTDHILDFAPDVDIAHGFSIPANSGFRAELMNRLRGLTENQTLDLVRPVFEKMVNAKLAEFGADLSQISRLLVLDSMDKQWMEHLETMADIRSGIGLQGYAQRNPLVEYKNIAFTEFERFISQIDSFVARRLLKIAKVDPRQNIQAQELRTNAEDIADILTGDRELLPQSGMAKLDEELAKLQQKANRRSAQLQAVSGKAGAVKKESEVGRNDLCPCGSGKKYKKCGMLNTEEHQKNLGDNS